VKLEEMLMDMLLMFENACVYNEPGSLIYKDALVLQVRICGLHFGQHLLIFCQTDALH